MTLYWSALAFMVLTVTGDVYALDIIGNNGSPSDVFPLGLCQGDCDNDIECFGDLTCFMRTGFQTVPGCSGAGQYGKDYCYNPQKPQALTFLATKQKHPESYPLRKCQGQCDSDADCADTLKRFQRTGTQTVPGCTGTGVTGRAYCYSPAAPGTIPNSPSSSVSVTPGVTTATKVTYVPGLLTVVKAGLRLSAGLDVRIVANKDRPVKYYNGAQSLVNFHTDPDAAGIFKERWIRKLLLRLKFREQHHRRGWIDRVQFKGDVLGYRRVLSGTQRNCGGGRSPTTPGCCEENGKNGFVWEVSPGGKFVGRKTNLVPEGGNYESVAYEFDLAQGRNVYYITEDSPTGALVQFVPSANLGTPGEMYSQGTHRYLRVDSGNFGTFSWVAKKSNATPQLYPNVEGIDAKDGFLYFVSKVDKTLFILNLAAGIFTKESTNQGLFNDQPDQVNRIIGVDPHNVLYFCEDGGSYCGIHGRTSAGKYVTIIDNDPNSGLLTGETTGLAFSPDGRRMYVSFQKPGVIFEISRTDGYSFGGDFIDVKYHAI
ncbi:Bacterial protein of unknown function (DUF839) [Fragilaria crotonensis]|nr:Bacterial protein of unknown function (DUF839) [Fragilaria crotonensis]